MLSRHSHICGPSGVGVEALVMNVWCIDEIYLRIQMSPVRAFYALCTGRRKSLLVREARIWQLLPFGKVMFLPLPLML